MDRSAKASNAGSRPRGRFGIDALWVPVLWLVIGLFLLAMCVTNLYGDPPWSYLIAALCLIVGLAFLAGGCIYLYATGRGKFWAWNQLLNGLELAGTERALDLGCGRGAVAIMLAQRLPHGSVTGVDLWRSRDQSGNTTEHAEQNLRANDVSDRVRLITGDMTDLPFPDASFDLVTASLAIHNIHAPGGREAALREALRVLTPTGQLVIVDISATAQYVQLLSSLGATAVSRRRLGWRVWWTGPWMGTSVVTAAQAPSAGPRPGEGP